MRRFDHRAIPSASLLNRTLDATGKLFTFQCGAWGNSYSSAAIYQSCAGGQVYLEGEVVDTPNGWSIPFETKPSLGVSYDTVAYRYHMAAVMRSTYGVSEPPILPNITGADLLLRSSPLKGPTAIFAGARPGDPTGPQWAYGTDLNVDNPDQLPVTIEPYDPIENRHGDWPYPGGKSQDGVSWFADNPNISHDSPYWMYPATADLTYSWAPALPPPPAEKQAVWGGLDLLGLEGYGAGIIAWGGHIGLPMELQIGCLPRIVSAKCEVSFTEATLTRRVFHQTVVDGQFELTTTETTTNESIGMTLLAGRTRNGWTKWDVVGAQVSGTYNEGKTSVVDVTQLLQRLCDLSSSDYDSFCMLPSIAAAWVEPGSSGRNMLEDLLGPEPEWTFHDTLGWYISYCQFQQLSFSAFQLSPPVVTIELPDSELERAVIPVTWPPMA